MRFFREVERFSISLTPPPTTAQQSKKPGERDPVSDFISFLSWICQIYCMNSYKLYAIQLFAVGDYSFLLLLHLLVRVNSIIIETSASCSFKGDREEVKTHTPKHDHSPQCLQITPLTILQFLRGVEVEGFIPLYLLHGRALDVLFCSTFLSTFFFCSTTNDHVKKTKKWMRTFKEVPVPAE
jgi:hypothetical protein